MRMKNPLRILKKLLSWKEEIATLSTHIRKMAQAL